MRRWRGSACAADQGCGAQEPAGLCGGGHADTETFSAPDCLTVVVWYRKALAMCGFAGVQVK